VKSPLPEKTCPVCQRPFQWRKRWQRCWDEVIYCSDACRRGTPRGRAGAAVAQTAPATLRPSKTRR
jgi:hypothetical protein